MAEEKPWLFTLKFWILFVLSISSAFCSLLICFYFSRRPKQFSIHHHTTVILALLSFIQVTTDFPFVMMYYERGEVPYASNSFCLWWNWWDYSTSSASIFIMTWACIERHILIFSHRLFSTREKRFFFHIVPMFLFIAYPFIFYLVVIVLNSCENYWDYTMLLCIQPCFLIDQPILATYDFLADILCPIFIILFANILLIARIVCVRRHRPSIWRRQRKLAVQLFVMSMIYLVFWLPLTINGLIITLTASEVSLQLQNDVFFFTIYFVPILLPLVFPSLLKNFVKTVCPCRRKRIEPIGPIFLTRIR